MPTDEAAAPVLDEYEREVTRVLASGYESAVIAEPANLKRDSDGHRAPADP